MADLNSINIVILVGRVAGDIKYDKGKGPDQSVSLVRFSLATNEYFQDSEGKSKSKVQYHNLVAFSSKADLCHKHCRKGMLLAIKGKLRNSKWQDEQGNKRWSTQVGIDEITFLGKKEDYEKAAAPKKWGKDDPL